MADLSDVVPILIVGYVLFGIISAFVRLIRQAGKANQAQPAAAAAPSSPGLTADQVRANLARRRIAQGRAAAAAPAVPAVVAAPPPRIYDVTASSMDPLSISSVGLLSGPAPDISLVKLWTTLPPAAVAVLASAIIGPCAARRGSGHQPEDW
jgi:hypothetical protein